MFSYNQSIKQHILLMGFFLVLVKDGFTKKNVTMNYKNHTKLYDKCKFYLILHSELIKHFIEIKKFSIESFKSFMYTLSFFKQYHSARYLFDV